MDKITKKENTVEREYKSKPEARTTWRHDI